MFWAYVRAITEALGAAKRGSDKVAAYSLNEMIAALQKLGRPTAVLGNASSPTRLGTLLLDYFNYRAALLNNQVEKDLMHAEDAKSLYEEVVTRHADGPPVPVYGAKGVLVAESVLVRGKPVRIPMNKQKDEKRTPAYLTGIVSVLIAYFLNGRDCDYDPQRIPVVDHEGGLYAALSRRMDGAFPSTENPIAFWELKEYYYTTTFGSKISDGVYITALDGYERREVEGATGRNIDHIIMVDAHFTWWKKGKPYLCRFVDLINMGLVDEVMFGREVVRRIPGVVETWLRASPNR